MKNEGKLSGLVAIVTGGSRGIGRAVAAAFLKEGARVMLAARDRDQLLKTCEDFKKEFGEKVAAYPTDVSRSNDVKSLIETTLQVFGEVDVLVNSAGIYGPIGRLEEVDFEKWKETFDVNVFGTFKMMQEIIPQMRKKHYGKIINFSGGGDGPLPSFSAYNASKTAVVRLTETLAEELKEYGIDVNAIAPGPVNTRLLDEALAAGEEKVGRERYAKLLKQKEEGGVSPEKAVELCVFLASADSDGLTGRFLSAVWDDWKTWNKKKIEEIIKTDRYKLRRLT